MIIIVEGVDRVGKSTLCKRLQKELGYKIFHDEVKPAYVEKYKPGSKNVDKVINEVIRTKFNMIMQFTKLFDGIIIDRFHFTEYVYDCMRGLQFEGLKEIDEWLAKQGAYLVLVDSEDIEESSKQHGEDLRAHSAMFRALFHGSKVRNKYITSYSKLDEVVLDLKVKYAVMKVRGEHEGNSRGRNNRAGIA